MCALQYTDVFEYIKWHQCCNFHSELVLFNNSSVGNENMFLNGTVLKWKKKNLKLGKGHCELGNS